MPETLWNSKTIITLSKVVSFDYNAGSKLEVQELDIAIIQINTLELGKLVNIFVSELSEMLKNSLNFPRHIWCWKITFHTKEGDIIWHKVSNDNVLLIEKGYLWKNIRRIWKVRRIWTESVPSAKMFLILSCWLQMFELIL